MRNIKIVNFEEAKVEDNDVLILEMERIHDYSSITLSVFEYYFQNNSIILTFSKNDKDIEYELEVSSELFKLLEKHEHFIMLESSKDYGDINYIVHKLK